MAGHLRVGGIVAEGREEEMAQSHGAKDTGGTARARPRGARRRDRRPRRKPAPACRAGRGHRAPRRRGPASARRLNLRLYQCRPRRKHGPAVAELQPADRVGRLERAERQRRRGGSAAKLRSSARRALSRSYDATSIRRSRSGPSWRRTCVDVRARTRAGATGPVGARPAPAGPRRRAPPSACSRRRRRRGHEAAREPAGDAGAGEAPPGGRRRGRGPDSSGLTMARRLGPAGQRRVDGRLTLRWRSHERGPTVAMRSPQGVNKINILASCSAAPRT